MGDRGNIVIEKDDSLFTAPVFFYTHWNGSGISGCLKHALKVGRERWDDPQYLARIIFDSLTDGDRGLTGFGISTVLCDNSHPLLCVQIEQNKVRLRQASQDAMGSILKEWSFQEFIDAPEEEEE